MEVDSIQIFAGQRYSFVLYANQRISNYWIRALSNVGSQAFPGGMNSAVLRYSGALNQDPTTPQTISRLPMRETYLHPLLNLGVPGPPVLGAADINVVLDIAFDSTTSSRSKYTLNGTAFVPPTDDCILRRILGGVMTAKDLLPTGGVFVLPPNEVVEVTLRTGPLADGGPVRAHSSFS